MPDLPEEGEALFVAGDRTLRVAPMALDATQGAERYGGDPGIAQPAAQAQAQALLAQRRRANAVALRPDGLSQLDEDDGDAGLVTETAVEGEALFQ